MEGQLSYSQLSQQSHQPITGSGTAITSAVTLPIDTYLEHIRKVSTFK